MENANPGISAADGPRPGDPSDPPPVGSKGCRSTLWLYIMLVLLLLAIIAGLTGGSIFCFSTTALLLGSLGFGMILFAEGPGEGDPPDPPPVGAFYFGIAALLALILAAILYCVDLTLGGLTPLGVYLISVVFSMSARAVRMGVSTKLSK